jgi:hypothetical protein
MPSQRTQLRQEPLTANVDCQTVLGDQTSTISQDAMAHPATTSVLLFAARETDPH